MSINKNTQLEGSEANKTPYDNYIYEGYPFGSTRPEYLRTIGVLFGMNPPKVSNARILELGCSTGGNLLNFAANFPDSYSLGIDLSSKQVDYGNQIIKDLGLTNVELKHLSIMDVNESLGKFDYIICHGVFSWVPGDVQDKILEICNKLLNKNGISYISYNVLPGWNMLGTMRDMMMFHSSTFNSDIEKVGQAKAFLNFVNESLEGTTSAHAKFLKTEAATLSQYEDQYIRHEYLAEENTQFYFHQFVDMASKHSLAYLGDASVYSMYVGNLPEQAAKQLSSIGDIVRTEQYMDFIYNRRFRCSLLVNQAQPINRSITSNVFYRFYTMCALSADKLEKDVNLNDKQEVIKFSSTQGTNASISTSSPAIKAIFYTYISNSGNPLKIDEILQIAKSKIQGFRLEDIKAEFDKILCQFAFNGYLRFFDAKPKSIFNIEEKPKVTMHARYQARNAKGNKFWVTNQINERINLQIHENYVLELLDGTNNIAEISDKILEKFLTGALTLHGEQGVRITDRNMLINVAKNSVLLSLEKFKNNFLLIA